MTTILVTGSNGQLATCIKDVEKQYSNLNIIYTDYQELDICNLKQVQTFFESNKQINYCINCAAYTAVDKAESEVDKAYAVNTQGAKNLAISCKENNTTLIHISTDFVFDGKSQKPYTETDKAIPISVYGETKLKGEIEIKQLLDKYFILRTSWLYSEYGNNFMKTMLRLSETRDKINVVSDQIGTPTYAGDLAKVILKIITEDNKYYGIYHYSNDGVASWFDFAKAIFKLSRSTIKVNAIAANDYPTTAKRPRYSVLDKKKIKNTLGTTITHWQVSLETALDKFLKS